LPRGVLKRAIRSRTDPETAPERSSGTATRVHAASTSPQPFQRSRAEAPDGKTSSERAATQSTARVTARP
jgi:hypothetical protein